MHSHFQLAQNKKNKEPIPLYTSLLPSVIQLLMIQMQGGRGVEVVRGTLTHSLPLWRQMMFSTKWFLHVHRTYDLLLTHSLPLWHQMMFFAKWFLRVRRTSYNLLLQFPLFMHSKLEQSFRNAHCRPAKCLWEAVPEQNFHQQYKRVGRERVNDKTNINITSLPQKHQQTGARVCLVHTQDNH